MQLDQRPVAAPTTTLVGSRILTAAADLFQRDGITATGVDRIVDAAETTKRTLYQRFGSKGALVAAYLQQRAHRWQSELTEALVPVTDREAALTAVYDLARAWAGERSRGCAFVNAWAELGASDHEAVRVIRAEKAWMRAVFDVIAGSEAGGAELHLLYEGAQVMASIRQDAAPFAEALAVSKRLAGA